MIKLISTQIPTFWEVIKYAAVRVSRVSQENLKPYLNELLLALLNDKAQCFIKLDDERMLNWLLISRIVVNKTTGEKYLYGQCIYSFKAQDVSAWEKMSSFLEKFARSESCSYISIDSSNDRVIQIAESVGYKEQYKNLTLRLGGE